MNLPKKDRNNRSYLSYSEISLFKKDKERYYNQYIIGQKFKGNAYTDFGIKVGNALEKNDFSKFGENEQKTLKLVTRLDQFERPVFLNYVGFYVIGFIDTISNDYNEIIDYKTGGQGKDCQYFSDNYTQLHIYSLAIRQETGITPSKASVEFIKRLGNPSNGEKLIVSNEEPIKINVDISYDRLRYVYFDIISTAKKINEFYLKYS
jgi:hypothetical protein